MAAPAAIDKAIEDATKEILEETPPKDAAVETQDSPDKKEDEESESSEEPTGSEDEPSDDEFDNASLVEAKNLYRALKSDKAPAIIAALAQQAGLLNADTKKEVREDVKSLQEIVTDALGEQYKFLAPQMTKMMTAVLENERSERTAKFNEIEQRDTQTRVNSAMEKVARENKISVDQLGRMISPLTEEFLPGPKTSEDTYIRGLYKQATVGRVAAKTNAQIADKARRNASDAPSRLQTTGSVSDKAQPSKKMSLKESIAFAQEQIKAHKD